MSNTRKSLADIVNGSGRDDLARLFLETEAATDLVPLPRGKYRCRITDGELTESRSAKPGYSITFVVDDGEHKGRRVWHTCWLTPAAMPMTRRDLLKLGVTELRMLDRPLPAGIVCEVQVALRVDDDGVARNRVVSFDVVAVLPDPTGDEDFASTVAASPAVVQPAPAAATPVPAATLKQPAVGRYLPGQKTLPIMDEPKAKGGAA